jgi:hypothetical protein
LKDWPGCVFGKREGSIMVGSIKYQQFTNLKVWKRDVELPTKKVLA